MSTLRPEQVVFRGQVLASGVLLPRRAASLWPHWRPGCTVWSGVPDRWLLRWPSPRLMSTDAAGGALLCALDGLLTACPLSVAERGVARQMAADGGGVFVCAGGRLGWHPIERLDPTHLVDLGPVHLSAAHSLAVPPPLAAAPAPTQAADPIAGLVGALIGEPPPEQLALLADLRGESPTEAVESGLSARLSGAFDRVVRVTLSRVLGAPAGEHPPGGGAPIAPASWLSRLLARLSPGNPPDTAGAPSGALAPVTPPRPSWRQRMYRALMRRGVLGTTAQRRQARYLRRMFALFEEQDLHEALRHAIPLGGDAQADQPIGGGTLAPRDELQIAMAKASGPTHHVGLAPVAHNHLESLYRAAVSRLITQGQIHEAAFALAELLGDIEGAVDLYEDNGMHLEAAELAQARDLPADRVAYLLWRAGEIDRAMKYAVYHDAFGAICWRIERTDPTGAGLFRQRWGEAQEAAGQYVCAAEIFETHACDPEAGLRCWQTAANLGDLTALAELLSRPATRDAYRELFAAALDAAALDAPGPLASHRRLELADTLSYRSDDPAVLRPLFRALARDQSQHQTTGRLGTLKRIERKLASDPLGAESVRWPSAPVGEVPVLVAPAPGAAPIEDAVVLPSGRLLVALGEGGLAQLATDGRVLRRYDFPATHLIPSAEGVVLAMVRRAAAWRLARIDLVDGRLTRLGAAPFDAWARNFDGQRLFVAAHRPEGGSTLMGLDITGGTLGRRWSVLVGPISAIWHSKAQLVALVEAPDGLPEERLLWRFELPGPTLRGKSGPFGAARERALAPVSGDAPALHLSDSGPGFTAQSTSAHTQVVCKDEPGDDGGFIFSGPEHLLSDAPHPAGDEAGRISRVLRWRDGKLRCTVVFPGAARVRGRIQGKRFLLFDDQGRLLVGQLEAPALLSWARLLG